MNNDIAKWIYRGLMGASLIAGGLVTGGVLPLAWAGVAAAVGTAAGLFHEVPFGGNDAAK